jgi:hypothetical protein
MKQRDVLTLVVLGLLLPEPIGQARIRACLLDGPVVATLEGRSGGERPQAAGPRGAPTVDVPEKAPENGLEFIDTGFENASPLWYEVGPDGTIQVHLVYDHERSSPNRAAGHIHFRLHARPGSKLTLEFRNLENVWNGRKASVANELRVVVVSEDGRTWRPTRSSYSPGTACG